MARQIRVSFPSTSTALKLTALLGLAFITAGLALISMPVAFIFAGAALVVSACALAWLAGGGS